MTLKPKVRACSRWKPGAGGATEGTNVHMLIIFFNIRGFIYRLLAFLVCFIRPNSRRNILFDSFRATEGVNFPSNGQERLDFYDYNALPHPSLAVHKICTKKRYPNVTKPAVQT